MNVIERLHAKNHILMPGDTISGIIKKYNNFNVSSDEMIFLLEKFKEINIISGALKPGMNVLIPLLNKSSI